MTYQLLSSSPSPGGRRRRGRYSVRRLAIREIIIHERSTAERVEYGGAGSGGKKKGMTDKRRGGMREKRAGTKLKNHVAPTPTNDAPFRF
jgi:hypothetical protein